MESNDPILAEWLASPDGVAFQLTEERLGQIRLELVRIYAVLDIKTDVKIYRIVDKRNEDNVEKIYRPHTTALQQLRDECKQLGYERSRLLQSLICARRKHYLTHWSY
jgi:hypothetical protein